MGRPCAVTVPVIYPVPVCPNAARERPPKRKMPNAASRGSIRLASVNAVSSGPEKRAGTIREASI